MLTVPVRDDIHLPGQKTVFLMKWRKAFMGRIDSQRLGVIHDQVQNASVALKNIQLCKVDAQAMKLRVEIRIYLKNARRRMRDLKRYINKGVQS